MFTGLVEALALVAAVESRPPGRVLVLDAGELADGVRLGDSIAINGCCLTCIAIDSGKLSFEAGPETLSRTTLGRLAAGSKVNLERSLRVGDRLGGHFVSGHVDDVGRLARRRDEKDWSTFWFRFPERLRSQMAAKGSIAVDGVSLTLVDVSAEEFSVALIPHTLAQTTLGGIAVGDGVNLETDLLAKYVEQQIAARP
jgi:riboflavin synthase